MHGLTFSPSRSRSFLSRFPFVSRGFLGVRKTFSVHLAKRLRAYAFDLLQPMARVCVCVHPWTKGFFQPIHPTHVQAGGR